MEQGKKSKQGKYRECVSARFHHPYFAGKENFIHTLKSFKTKQILKNVIKIFLFQRKIRQFSY